MSWPADSDAAPDLLEALRTAHVDLAQTLSGFEPVTVACDPADAVEVSLRCGNGIQVLPLAGLAGTIRDAGFGFAAAPDQGLALVRRAAARAAEVALVQGLAGHLKLSDFVTPLGPGPGIETDGAGTVMLTEETMASQAAARGLDPAGLEPLIRAATGATAVIRLGQGCRGDPTGGAAALVARFVRPGVVAAMVTDDPGDGNFAPLQDNLDRLTKARDAAGHGLEVIPIRQPARQDWKGARLPLSYLDFVFANGAIVLPEYEDSADQEASRILRRLYPERTVIQLPAAELARAGANLRRIAQPQPVAASLPGHDTV
jgi:agmatine deiminase